MPPQTSSTGSLDPQAIALSKAIRQVESGGDPVRKGPSGEFGAYQFLPATWNEYSREAGVNVPLERASLSDQNQVAYHKIKQWKDAGYNPGQIASMWNAGPGTPNAYMENHRGVNAQGVSYDTPKYAKEVATLYQQYKSGTGLPQAASNQDSVTQDLPGMPSLPEAAQVKNEPYTPSYASQPQQSTGGGLVKGIGNFLRSAEAPFLGVAAIPYQALASALGQEDPFTKGIGGGQTPGDVTPLNLEQKAGDIAQVGSYFVPGSGVLGAAGMGALQGAGSAMSQGEDLATVAGQGAIGAGIGAGAAGLTKLGGRAIQEGGDLLSGERAQKAIQGIKKAYGSAINLNASERAFESRTGKDLAQVLVDTGAPLGRYENGTLDASKAIPMIQQRLEPLNNEANAILGGSRNTVNLLDAASAAKAAAASKNLPALDASHIAEKIDKYMQAEVEQRATKIAQETYGLGLENLNKRQAAKVLFDAANPPVIEADKIKSAFWNAVGKGFDRDTQLSENATYQLGHAVKDAVEAAVPDARLAEVNSERGDLIDAIRRLTKLDGARLLKGGRLGNIATGAVGAIAGASSGLGPLAAIGGDFFGQKAGEFLQNPATKIAIAAAKAKMAAVPAVSKTLGRGLTGLGDTIAKGARGAGLVANLLTK